MRWTKIALPCLLVVLIGWWLYWFWPAIAPIARHPVHGWLTNALTQLLLPPKLSESTLTGLPMLGLLVIGGLTYVVVSIDHTSRPRRRHGSAHRATGRESRKYRVRPTLPAFRPRRAGRTLAPIVSVGGRAAASKESRLRLGWYQRREISLSEQQQFEHVLLTAPTGAGKSARVIIPNLLREIGSRSLFIGDLKNELYQVTAGWLAAQSMQVWLFAPLRQGSQGYNPLAHIKSVEQAQDFAETWVANTGGEGGKDGQFWTNNAKLLITSMTLHLLASEQAPALSRLADLLTTSSFEEIRDLLNATRSTDARRLARQFLANMAQNERLVGSVMTDVGVRFQLLASPQARAATATNEIDFQEMIETPTAFYLTIPPSAAKRYRPLLAVLMQQMFSTWEKRGTDGVGCYLDEFTNLGYVPGYAEFISTARALHVSLLMAIQNFSQLNERYGRNDAETIKANAITHLLLPGAGLEETKYYSERIGDTTIATETVNRRGSEMTSSESETRRRLMTADELRTMPENQMLMLEAKSPPLLLTTRLYFKERGLASRANLPYHVTHVRQEAAPPPAEGPQGLPAGGQQSPQSPIVVDADEEDDDTSFFQQE
jgi:type IV secretion system protein VirD4